MSRNITKRFRDYGFSVGDLPTGKKNTIADVKGVKVGHVTLSKGRNTKTGVTIIDPGRKNIFKDKLPAAISVGNGYGKLIGITQVEELGALETPIALTNTLATGRVARGIVDLVLKTSKVDPLSTVNPVVGETNDGYVNDIHKNNIAEEHVMQAYKNRSSNVEIGCVGAGTGTRAFSWKGGIGTASRQIKLGKNTHTVGVLVQTNFGGLLQVMGVPIGKKLGRSQDANRPAAPDGSCMIVIATDAPLTARQLKRIAKRAFFGLARTGSVMAHGSGDYAIAFSTSRNGIEGKSMKQTLADSDLTPLFQACIESVEESVYDALFVAKTTKGRDNNQLKQIPVNEVVEHLKKAAV